MWKFLYFLDNKIDDENWERKISCLIGFCLRHYFQNFKSFLSRFRFFIAVEYFCFSTFYFDYISQSFGDIPQLTGCFIRAHRNRQSRTNKSIEIYSYWIYSTGWKISGILVSLCLKILMPNGLSWQIPATMWRAMKRGNWRREENESSKLFSVYVYTLFDWKFKIKARMMFDRFCTMKKTDVYGSE